MNMKHFTESIGFLVFFLIGTLLLSVTLGEKVTFWFLLLVLTGMVVFNVDKFSEVIGRFSKV